MPTLARGNARRLTLTDDQACNLVTSAATGQLDAVDPTAVNLQNATQPRR
jgi:hypothetical protein